MTALLPLPTARRTRTPGQVRLAGPVLAGVVLVAALAGCGSSSDDAEVVDPGAAPSASAAASGPGATALTITVVDGTKTSTWTLSCDPPGGDHPDPAAACAALAADQGKALEPVGKDMMCTQIYGGSQTATITGDYNGTAVQSTFSRTNGCEIARWKALDGLLPSFPAGPL